MAQSIPKVLEELEVVVDWCLKHAPELAYFPAVYHYVTSRIHEAVQTPHVFDQPERMSDFDTLFATRYLDAFRAFRTGQQCSQSWFVAFTPLPDRRRIILQHVLAGMNAHIALDLGVAAAATARQYDGLDSLERDYLTVNRILEDEVNPVENQICVLSPRLHWLDICLGPVDEALATFSVASARDRAWRFACHLHCLPLSAHPQAIHEQDISVAHLGRKLLYPGMLAKILVAMIARRECESAEYNAHWLMRLRAPAPL